MFRSGAPVAMYGTIATSLALLFLALPLATPVSSQEVVTLTDDTFDTYTSSGMWLVAFKAPWCGHCKALKPVFDEAAQLTRGQIRLGEVDATTETGLKARFDIKGFPTLKFARNGIKWQEYDSGRDVQAFVDFAARMKGPAVHALSTRSDVQSFVEANPLVFVHCRPEAGGSEDTHAAFKQAAEELQHIHMFGELSTPETCALVTGPAPGAEFIAKLERNERSLVYDGVMPPTPGDILAWVDDNQFPLLSKLQPSVYRRLAKTNKLLVIAVVFEAELTDSATPSARLIESTVAASRIVRHSDPSDSALANQFHFGVISVEDWRQFVQQFMKFEEAPGLFVLDINNKVFYRDEEVDEVDEIETFLHEVLEGKVPAQRQGGGGLMAWMDWLVERLATPQVMLLVVGLVALCGIACTTGGLGADRKKED